MKRRKRTRRAKPALLITVTRGGLEISLFPWEDPAVVLAEVEAFLSESDARPWLNDEDLELTTPEMGRLWGG